ncbi:ATP-binding protein [uncultured Marinobacter sp.]|uniref:ATP-binding protein n=1 Tax=uncultured Marinobacter sp. TaxID=187379 RepID=UPI0030D97130|tara:strand:+ start:2462 stop:5485 length:3024 start_codon:yes stop_codon:yes gene_type:complete
MPETPQHSNEEERLSALHHLALMDSPPEQRFDRITTIARALFDVPIALITLVDADRQWFKSSIGTDQTETPRCVSFCAHAVTADSALIVEDATLDDRFRDNPLVTGDMHIRFYAGYPIHAPGGQALGAVCVIDQKPRCFDDNERLLLEQLARMVDEEIQARSPIDEEAPTEDDGFSHRLQRIGSLISRRLVSLAIAVTVFFVIMLVAQADFLNESENERLQKQASLSETLFNLRGRLETELNARLHLTHGLAGYVRSGTTRIESESFQNFAADLGNSLTGIRSLQLAPDGIVSYLWPEESNRRAIGHNLLGDPDRRVAALKAIELQQLWVAGPLDLIQGGTALIGRRPIFVTNLESGVDYFWGFATVLIDLQTLLDEAGFGDLPVDRQIALRGRNGLGAEGEVFYGSPAVFDGYNLNANISLPSGSWQIAIAAEEAVALSGISPVRWSFAIGLSAIISCLLYFLLRLPFRYATAVNKAKQALNRSNVRFKDAIEALPDGFAVFDAGDRLVRCNEKYREFFATTAQLIPLGTRFEDLLRESVESNRYVLDDDSSGGQQDYIETRLQHHRSPTSGGIELHLRAGRWLRAVESRVPSGGTVISYTDISELKNKEHELANEKSRAESANHAKTRFLATVSHELRTPMNAILGLLHLVQSSGHLDKLNQEYVDTTYESAEHLLNLLNELLDLSKMEAGKLELELSYFNLAQVVRKTLKLSEAKAQQKGLRLVDDIGEQANVIVRGDAGRLQQILMNLLSNGVKFTDQGTVTLTASRPTPDRFVFRITDTGIGFTDAQTETLFQPFSQLDSSASRQHEGTGLGLAICKRLIAAMGGTVRAHGIPGCGATFEFEIPLEVLSEAHESLFAPDPDRVVATPASTGRSPIRVLVAEDSPANQVVLKAMLKDTGYVADVVGNGLEAVEALRTLAYDVVLMDIFMPEMDGLEATRIIRSSKKMTGKPIIALTANAMPGDQEKFLEAGMDDYLAKPVTKADLLTMLNKWMLNNSCSDSQG